MTILSAEDTIPEFARKKIAYVEIGLMDGRVYRGDNAVIEGYEITAYYDPPNSLAEVLDLHHTRKVINRWSLYLESDQLITFLSLEPSTESNQ